MIRFTWLQFRIQALLAACALTIVAVVLGMTGPTLAHLYDTNIATCDANHDCATATVAFLKNYSQLQIGLGYLVIVVPALIGIFWGAPLVAREFEAGTYRLAWTQGVSRARWLATKLGLVGLAGMAASGLLSLMASWWFAPIDKVNQNQFNPPVFDERGLAPIGYAAFAFVLGVTAGVLIRLTLPAVGATLVGFVAVRLALILWVFPNLIAPSLASLPVSANSSLGFGPGPAGITFVADGTMTIPNAWVLSYQLVDKAGHVATSTSLHEFLLTACPSIAAGPAVAPTGQQTRRPASQSEFNDCIAQVGTAYHEAVTYQPADRYWTFQWYEMTIYLGLAVALAGLSFWWVRRRLT